MLQDFLEKVWNLVAFTGSSLQKIALRLKDTITTAKKHSGVSGFLKRYHFSQTLVIDVFSSCKMYTKVSHNQCMNYTVNIFSQQNCIYRTAIAIVFTSLVAPSNFM